MNFGDLISTNEKIANTICICRDIHMYHIHIQISDNFLLERVMIG